ncbi:MAG: hypothetical protein KF726_26660 [Anaerolineae bacterium]|nr:hypothetical protein [Anaerolineae bacterium]
MELQRILGVGCAILALLYAFRGLGALVSGRIMAAARLTRPMRAGVVQGARAQALGILLFICALVIALSGYLLLTGQSTVIAVVLTFGSLFFATLFESAVVMDPGQ